MSYQSSDEQSQTAAEYLNPVNGPEPSEETGLGTHFANTFDRSLKKQAPEDVAEAEAADRAAKDAAQKPAQQKLAATNSTMTTAQLQKAAQEGDPNGLKK